MVESHRFIEQRELEAVESFKHAWGLIMCGWTSLIFAK